MLNNKRHLCRPHLRSSSRDQDRLRAGSPAETVVQGKDAASEQRAVARASGSVAEPDVVSGEQAVCVGCVEAGCPAGVHSAWRAAVVADAVGAVDDCGVLGGARGERVDRLADERQLGVGVADPVHHLLGGYNVRRRL